MIERHNRIWLRGERNSGKSEIARALRNLHGYKMFAFADTLYEEVSEAFNVPIEFLELRATKEVPTYRLAIRRSSNSEFILRMLDLGYEIDVPRSPRWILQRWGTEYRLALYSDDYLVQRVVDKLTCANTDKTVVTDVRTVIELNVAEELGTVIEIVRPGGSRLAEKDTLSHPTETEIKDIPSRYRVENHEGRLDDAVAEVLAIVRNQQPIAMAG